MNQAIISGRLGKDIEIITTTTGKEIGKISVATNHSYKMSNGEYANETTWHNVTLYSPTDYQKKKLVKGSLVVVSGRIDNKFSEKDGKYYYSLIADKIEILLDATSKTESNESRTEIKKDEDDGLPF